MTLPTTIDHHCSVLVGDKVYVLGGNLYSEKVFTISIHDGSISNVPDMFIGHSRHSCASFTDGNKTFIAVAGGATYYDYRNITEIFDIQNNVWFRGTVCVVCAILIL